MVAARGAEESTAWRQPVDLVALCEGVAGQLAELVAVDRGLPGWSHHTLLADELLGDDPAEIIDALKWVLSRNTIGHAASAARWRRLGSCRRGATSSNRRHDTKRNNAIRSRILRTTG
jgi:hypothetical protein